MAMMQEWRITVETEIVGYLRDEGRFREATLVEPPSSVRQTITVTMAAVAASRTQAQRMVLASFKRSGQSPVTIKSIEPVGIQPDVHEPCLLSGVPQ